MAHQAGSGVKAGTVYVLEVSVIVYSWLTTVEAAKLTGLSQGSITVIMNGFAKVTMF